MFLLIYRLFFTDSFDHKLISETFDLPKNIIPVALLPVGYPSETANPTEKHTSRKELSETVIYL